MRLGFPDQEIDEGTSVKPLRPGGYELTRRAVDYCALQPGARILDLGCGSGLTVEYLIKNYNLQAWGIDPRDDLLKQGLQRNPALPIYKGRGESLPFPGQEIDCVIAECSFSLLPELYAVLKESHRVLRNEGWLIINDLYLRSKPQEPLPRPQEPPANPGICLDSLRTAEAIVKAIECQGFEMLLWEDHSILLKQFVFETIMHYGSMRNFWAQFIPDTEDPKTWQEKAARQKPGYYLLIARKQNR